MECTGPAPPSLDQDRVRPSIRRSTCEEVLGLVARKVAEALEADACFVYLYDERAGELVLRATHGTSGRGDDPDGPEDAAGRGHHRQRGGERAPVMIPSRRISIRASSSSRTCPRTSTSRSSPCRSSRARSSRRAQRAHDRAARVHRGRDRPARCDRRAGRADDRAREALRGRAGAGLPSSRRWRRSRRRSPSRSTSRSRWRRSSRRRWTPSARPARRSCSRTGRSPGRGSRRARTPCVPLRWKRRQIGELVCDRDTPFTDDDRALLGVDRPPCGGRARARARGDARRARPGDPSPR